MLPVEGQDLLRVGVLSGMLGFAAFCLSYGIYVWRRRNSAHRRSKSRPMKVAQILAILGCLGIVISWAFNEFQGRTGIAEGSGLYVVHARRESVDRQVTSADRIKQGDVLAEFLSPADRTRLAAIDEQQAQAGAKRDAIDKGVLQFDQELLQKQTHLRAELLQLKGFAFELRKTRYEIERSRTDLSTAWTREESQLIESVALAAREAAKATANRELTRRMLQRGQELQKQQHISQQEVDVRAAADLAADLTVKERKDAIAALRDRRGALEMRFAASDDSLAYQISEISKDAARVQASLDLVEAKENEIERSLREDRARAAQSRKREAEAVDYDISILSAEKARLTEAALVRAPFSGRVVYRHPAPGLATENLPILAISAGTGFVAKIRLPRDELDELAAQHGAVQLALDNPVLHHFFTGRFVRSEPVEFEPSRVIAYLDCSLPPEMTAYLGSTLDPVRVRLLWRPSLVQQRGFQLSLVILIASALALALQSAAPSMKRSRDTRSAEAAVDVHASQAVIDTVRQENDSVQAAAVAGTIAVRPGRTHVGSARRPARAL